EGGERDVDLAGPARRFEEQLGAADATERAPRAGRGFVGAELLGPGDDRHLLRLEPDPGDESRGMRPATALAVAMTAEARRKTRHETHPAAVALAACLAGCVVRARRRGGLGSRACRGFRHRRGIA